MYDNIWEKLYAKAYDSIHSILLKITACLNNCKNISKMKFKSF